MGTAMKEVKSPCTWTQWANLRVSYAHGQLVLGIVCVSKGKGWGVASSFGAKNSDSICWLGRGPCCTS